MIFIAIAWTFNLNHPSHSGSSCESKSEHVSGSGPPLTTTGLQQHTWSTDGGLLLERRNSYDFCLLVKLAMLLPCQIYIDFSKLISIRIMKSRCRRAETNFYGVSIVSDTCAYLVYTMLFNHRVNLSGECWYIFKYILVTPKLVFVH